MAGLTDEQQEAAVELVRQDYDRDPTLLYYRDEEGNIIVNNTISTDSFLSLNVPLLWLTTSYKRVRLMEKSIIKGL